MPIVVAHEPSYGAVGTAAYGIGAGMARERLEEHLRQQAERDAQRDFQAERDEWMAEQQANRDVWQAKTQAERDIWQADIQAERDVFQAETQAERDERLAKREADELQRKWNVSRGLTPDGDPPPEPKFSPAQEMERSKLQTEVERVAADPTLRQEERAAMIGALGQKYASIEPEIDDVRKRINRARLSARAADGSIVPGVYLIPKPDGTVETDDKEAKLRIAMDKVRVQAEAAQRKTRLEQERETIKTKQAADKYLHKYRSDLRREKLSDPIYGDKPRYSPAEITKMYEEERREIYEEIGVPLPTGEPAPGTEEPPPINPVQDVMDVFRGIAAQSEVNL